jgi:hypothetical protein
MGNFIIDTRIKKLERIKQGLLSLKKNQRGDELDQVNQMIARLKRWNMELEKEKFLKIPRKTFPNVGNYKPNFDFYKDRIGSTVPANVVLGMRIHESEIQSNKKDSAQDENIDTFCAMMRMSNE